MGFSYGYKKYSYQNQDGQQKKTSIISLLYTTIFLHFKCSKEKDTRLSILKLTGNCRHVKWNACRVDEIILFGSLLQKKCIRDTNINLIKKKNKMLVGVRRCETSLLGTATTPFEQSDQRKQHRLVHQQTMILRMTLTYHRFVDPYQAYLNAHETLNKSFGHGITVGCGLSRQGDGQSMDAHCVRKQ